MIQEQDLESAKFLRNTANNIASNILEKYQISGFGDPGKLKESLSFHIYKSLLMDFEVPVHFKKEESQ